MTNDAKDARIVSAYCVRCKDTVDMLYPEAVFTSRGTPGTRGECPVCEGTVFRMGATHMHEGLPRPLAVNVGNSNKRNKPKIAPNTVYINYAEADEDTAQQIAADLNKIGLTTWLHDAEPPDVKWAGGVHPALKECARMVLILSESILSDELNREAWNFFKQKRKPIVIIQLTDTEPPDDLRRSVRLDFTGKDDYKSVFRQMVQALSR